MNHPGRNPTTPHLTENELDDLLIGSPSAEASVHLAGCPACQSRRDGFLASMATFNHASQSWSEARSNALNRDLTGHRTPFRVSQRAAFACASLFVVLLAGSIDLSLRRHTDQSLTPASTTESAYVASSTTDNEIAGDNAMLQAIDNAIATPEPSPAQLYNDPSLTPPHSARHSEARN